MNAITKQTQGIVPWTPRLALPQEALGQYELTAAKWRTLTDAVFPNAKSASSILLALDYCRARGLDIMKRPVHVVPMWSHELGMEVETIWPSINEVQITAARTREWAGMDSPAYGPMIRKTFTSTFDQWEGEKGRRKKTGSFEKEVTLEFPEWCEVTVYRLVQGQRFPFTERLFWEETYARVGKGIFPIPNDTWQRRVRAQIAKCAKAASLRAGFPECGEYVAEEMEGQAIERCSSEVLENRLAHPAKTPSAVKAESVVVERDGLWTIVAPNGAEIDARDGLSADLVELQQELFEELQTREWLTKFVNKLVVRGTETSLWSSCVQLARERLRDQEVLWFALDALAKAAAEKGDKI